MEFSPMWSGMKLSHNVLKAVKNVAVEIVVQKPREVKKHAVLVDIGPKERSILSLEKFYLGDAPPVPR